MNKFPTYLTIIPANVRYDKNLCPAARLFYGEISVLLNEDGYCDVKNEYFAELYGVKRRQVINWIKQLIENGYIRIEIENGHKRKIYVLTKEQ